MEARKFPGVIKAYDTLSDAEKLERYKDAFQLYRGVRKELTHASESMEKELKEKTDTIKKQKKKINTLTKENEQLKAQLAVSPVLRIWQGLLRRVKRLLHLK